MSPIFWLKVSLIGLGVLIVLGLVFKIYNVGKLTERAQQMEASLRAAQQARRLRAIASDNPDPYLMPRRPAHR